jgi:mannose-6-phosphate isomerase-like protein (cupin superfamily)
MNWERRGEYEVKRLASSADLQAPGVEIQLFRFDGGKTTHYHKLRTEFYYITKGNGKAVVDGKVIELAVGSELLIPPGVKHSFENGSQNLEGIMLKTNTAQGDIFED